MSPRTFVHREWYQDVRTGLYYLSPRCLAYVLEGWGNVNNL